MGTSKSFASIFALLAVQLLLLVLFEGIGVSIAASGPSPLHGSGDMALFLSLMAGLLALLALAWFALLEPVDIYWGLSAKLRVAKWLIQALFLASLAVFCLVALIVGTGRESFGGIDFFEFADGALVAPIAVTGILIVSAARRWQAIRHGLAEMRGALQALGPARLDRVATSIAGEAGGSANSVRPNPRGFAFAGLTSKPWHDPAQFAWLGSFVDATAAIRGEAEQALAHHRSRVEHYRYAGLDGDFWTNFSFVKRHKELPENLALCPVVAGLLKTIPGYPGFRDAMLSILGPHGHIKPHRDVSNVFLTLHLPLVVAGDGYIEVGGIRRQWRCGEPLVFDSSYDHQAVNLADKPRIVLLVDFPHPDLTREEVAWISASRI